MNAVHAIPHLFETITENVMRRFTEFLGCLCKLLNVWKNYKLSLRCRFISKTIQKIRVAKTTTKSTLVYGFSRLNAKSWSISTFDYVVKIINVDSISFNITRSINYINILLPHKAFCNFFFLTPKLFELLEKRKLSF